MRISDWSSDVCSSDLATGFGPHRTMTAISGMALLLGDKRDATKIMRENGVKFSKSPDNIFSNMDMLQRRCRQSLPSWVARRQRCATTFLHSRQIGREQRRASVCSDV